MKIVVYTYGSPLGPLTLAADDEGLCGVWFEGQKYFGMAGNAVLVEEENGGSSAFGPSGGHCPAAIHLTAARNWLDAYFAGKDPGALSPMPPLHLMGTPFQRAVWDVLATIPYGATATYGAIAMELGSKFGRKTSARAVGGAVGRNPVSVIVPCHRVLGANNAITGYAGGLDRKRALLALEGIDL